MKVAVVGAGVVGASVALRLREGGADVLLIDAAQPGAGATGASFAWVNASSGLDDPAYYALRLAGMEEHARLGDAPWQRRTGHLRWVNGGEDALVARAERARELGYESEVWDAARVQRQLERNAAFPSPETPVVVDRRESWIDAPRLARAMVDRAVALGTAIRLGRRVVDLTVGGVGDVTLVLADGERHRADLVVNAAGAEAGALGGLVGAPLPLTDDPGLVVRLRVSGTPVGRAMHAPGVEIRPDGEDRVLLHSRAVDQRLAGGGHAAPDLVDRLHELGAEVVPALAGADVVDARVGWRPMPADGRPSIGRLGSVPGYVEAVMHSGITLGPLIGRLVAAELLDERIDPLAAPYRPDRFERA